jgi:hypothetical protein
VERFNLVPSGHEANIVIAIVSPTMLDILQICHDARAEEMDQYEATTGLVWHDDDVANYLYSKEGVKFSIIVDDIAVSVGGWEPLVSGVWQAWMIGTTDNWAKYWRTITKETRKIVAAMFTETETRRLQIPVLASRVKACEWFVRGLKFEYEGTMKQYGVSGEDVAMYVKFREA